MSIDFATLQGLSIPEGNVIEIKDATGRVLWAASGGKVILEVEKITSDTYAGETTYTGEQFILLDIYPKTNGTVTVTYGGLTKTITDTSGAAAPNAQQVFFGTFNGVTDEVATPAVGELTIEGNCIAFAVGDYKKQGTSKTETVYCGCITNVKDFGSLTTLGIGAFRHCEKLTSISIPKNMKQFRANAFAGCSGLASVYITSIKDWCESDFATADANPLCNGGDLYVGEELVTSVTIPDDVTKIKPNTFYQYAKLENISLLRGLESVGYNAFCGCTKITLTSLPSTLESIGDSAFYHISDFSFGEFPEGLGFIGANAFQINQNDNAVGAVGKDITLPSTLTSIGDNAFASANGYGASSTQFGGYLKSVRILATTPPTAGVEIFGYGFSGIITVPAGCSEAYKAAAGWSAYAGRIVEAS